MCNWRGKLTGDVYPSGYIVLSHLGFAMLYLFRQTFFSRTCRDFGYCNSNIPRYFLDFSFRIFWMISYMSKLGSMLPFIELQIKLDFCHR